MKRKCTIATIYPEVLVPELPEPTRRADFRGGLGKLAADTLEGLAKRNINAIGIGPAYSRDWLAREMGEVSYEGISGLRHFSRLNFKIGEEVVSPMMINRGGTKLFLLHSPRVFTVLYCSDRWQRLKQEVLLGHAVPALLKNLRLKPDIVWLQEGHTGISAPVILEDPYFKGVKLLLTTHTPMAAGLEKFPEAWFDHLRIHEKYKQVYIRDGFIDLTRGTMALADMINAVSQEHLLAVKEMFPEFADKMVGVTNGSSRELWMSPRLKEAEANLDLIKLGEVHEANKRDFIAFVKAKTGKELDPSKPLICLVRRLADYKSQLPMLAPIVQAICAERGETVSGPCGELRGLGEQIFIGGVAHESDSKRLEWMQEFTRWMSEPELNNKFVYLPDYNMELLQWAKWGCDVWLTCPMPRHCNISFEACSTSDREAAEDGKVNVATRTAGPMEYIIEYNPVTGEGNGFYIDPFEPITIYNKLGIISDLHRLWRENGDDRWLRLKMNAYESGKKLDIVYMIDEYRAIFEKLLNSDPN